MRTTIKTMFNKIYVDLVENVGFFPSKSDNFTEEKQWLKMKTSVI